MRRPDCLRYGILIALAFLLTPFLVHAQNSSAGELEKNWKLVSASNVSDTGAEISQPGYGTGKWYPIQKMPATVLRVLEEDGVYPNLYYGMNFQKVPPDLYKQDWWYRTSFQVPDGRRAYWIDFPGINYRAEIWMNGRLLANDTQVVGMYVDHRFNVTDYVHPGQENVLAVKVIPERPYSNGVELGTTWVNWINWTYFGYHGPFNLRGLQVPATVTVAYVAPNASQPASDVTTHISIVAAGTDSVTLKASIATDGHPVRSGTAIFSSKGNVIGRGEVETDGTATLKITREEDVHQIEGEVSNPSFVSDRNAGIWKPVTFRSTGAVKLSNALVDTDLPLPAINPATLTVYVDVTNGTSTAVHGSLQGEITRPGKPVIHVEQSVSLSANESREVSFTANRFPQLVVHNPDLWWPYTMGEPALYDLHLRFVADNQVSDEASIRFGIRKVTQHRDQDEQFPSAGKGGSFYLQINGRNFLVRGAAYAPDLLFHSDPARDATEMAYVKDMGLNMIRWEGHFPSPHILELADEEGVPVMYGWVCCAQWESWRQWSAEDYRVAPESLRSQILTLRSHASAFLWANGSDGLPPEPLRDEYNRVLKDLHWQNAVVDTVSSDARGPGGKIEWDGIHMMGPYTWRPPSYWFAELYVGARGAVAEQGNNENIPPYESLQKFIPPDKLWPPNEYWYFHAGAYRGSDTLLNERRAIRRRYGPSSSAQELAKKAQVAEYEETRAQFEDFAANGWANHKMTIYWMLSTVWPSFYAHLYDYYLNPGGSYYGAKKGLRPLSVVFDYYATGDRRTANITVVNQTPVEQKNLRVRVRIYDIDGQQRLERTASDIQVSDGGAVRVLTLPRPQNISSTYFVRCELFDGAGKKVVENVYWQSTTPDDIGGYGNREIDDNPPLNPKQVVSWANLTALNSMPPVRLHIQAHAERSGDDDTITLQLHNPTDHIAFFERWEVTKGKNGEGILPILYSDNYVTLFPGETVQLSSTYKHALIGKSQPWLRLEGYNSSNQVEPIH